MGWTIPFPKVIRAAFLLLVACAARAEEHEFVYDASDLGERPKSVHVAGDFNGWSKDSTPMSRHGSIYKASVDLAEGVHYYKFVVNDDKWVNDPVHSDKALEVDD